MPDWRTLRVHPARFQVWFVKILRDPIGIMDILSWPFTKTNITQLLKAFPYVFYLFLGGEHLEV